MNRRTRMACLGLIVAASVGSAQVPPTPGIPGVPGLPGGAGAPAEPAPTHTPAPAVSPAPAAAPSASCAAEVGGVSISTAELEVLLKQSELVPVHMTERQQEQIRLRALSTLIDGVLLRKFLDAKTKPADPAEVQRRLAEMEADLRKHDKSLAEFCQDARKTIDQVKADIADQLRWSRYEGENLTEANLMKFYTDNKDFFDGVTVRASHIVVRIPPKATPADRLAARQKLERLRKQLLTDPKPDFDELAKSLPDKGGDMGWIPRKWFDEEFSRAAFALPKGQVSEVVQTEFGLHLIKVTDRQAGKPTEFAKIRETVREFCAQDLRQAILALQRKQVEIKVHP